MFHIIEGAHVVTHSRGVYRQSDVYRNNEGVIFAKHGAGFIKITRHGTSVPNIRVIEHDGFNPEYDKLGNMVVT